MRNAWRVLIFDVAAPLATIAAILLIGVFLGWPVWWVAVAAMLCLLIVEAMVVNYVLLRRDRVTAGTDDDGPVGHRRADRDGPGCRHCSGIHPVDGGRRRLDRRLR
jgi:hypothetical protein